MRLFPRKRLQRLEYTQSLLNDTLVAIARLSFVKPKDLVREAKNIKANSEYLQKMVEKSTNESVFKKQP